MNPRLPQIVSLALALTAKSALDPSQLLNSLVEADGGYQFVDRGQNFAVLRKVTAASDANGGTTLTTNDITLLENNLHYLADGKWEPSRDVIEHFREGQSEVLDQIKQFSAQISMRKLSLTSKRRRGRTSGAECGRFN